MKKQFVFPEIEIIKFASETGVLTDSNGPAGDIEIDDIWSYKNDNI